jgi:Leucine-rich repeat (LRR) protein
LNLTNLGLTDSDIEPIGLLNLQKLTLDNCAVKDLHAIKNMSQLKSLNLEECKLSNAGIKVIANLNNLTGLDLTRSTIRDADLTLLESMPNLKWLKISGCSLTPQAVQSFKRKHPECEVLFLRGEKRQLKDGMETLAGIESSLMNQHEFDEADLSINHFISDLEKQATPQYECIAKGYQMRAQCQGGMNHPQAEKEMLMDCINVYAKHLPDSELLPRVQLDCAKLQELQDDPQGAIAMRSRANQFWQHHPPTGRARHLSVLNLISLGRLHQKLGDLAKAKDCFQKAQNARTKFGLADGTDLKD